MAAAYLITLPSRTGQVLQGGKDAMVVYANSTAEAKVLAQAALGGDANTLWGDSDTTVTAVAAATDWFTPTPWKFRIVVTDNVTYLPVVDVTVASSSADNTVDEIGALFVTALNATTPIAGAAYNTTSQVLTIAETTDGLGDNFVTVTAWPVLGAPEDGSINVGSFFGTVVHNGASSAALSVTLAADAAKPPVFYAALKQ